MNTLLETPGRALLAGLAITALVLVLWIADNPVDGTGLISVLLRFVHVIGAMAWVGLVFFVNFVQIGALAEADEAGRGAIHRWIVPRVAAGYRHASHLVLVSGVLLLIASGYVLGEWVFASAVYMPSARTTTLWAGVLGGLIMWALVHFAIWPNLKIALGETAADDGARNQARQSVKRYARLNLMLALPVTFAMVAAAHLS
jgi:uncharacterized membrane protein